MKCDCCSHCVHWYPTGFPQNRPISQIPECTFSVSHDASFGTNMCKFLFWMQHIGIWNRGIPGFVKLVYCTHHQFKRGVSLLNKRWSYIDLNNIYKNTNSAIHEATIRTFPFKKQTWPWQNEIYICFTIWEISLLIPIRHNANHIKKHFWNSSRSMNDIQWKSYLLYVIKEWNLSVTTTSIIKFITCDLFSNVFQWRLKVPIYSL